MHIQCRTRKFQLCNVDGLNVFLQFWVYLHGEDLRFPKLLAGVGLRGDDEFLETITGSGVGDPIAGNGATGFGGVRLASITAGIRRINKSSVGCVFKNRSISCLLLLLATQMKGFFQVFAKLI